MASRREDDVVQRYIAEPSGHVIDRKDDVVADRYFGELNFREFPQLALIAAQREERTIRIAAINKRLRHLKIFVQRSALVKKGRLLR